MAQLHPSAKPSSLWRADFAKGSYVFVKGELQTREYDRTITVPSGKNKSVEHVNQQLVVELKGDTVRMLDRSGSSAEPSDAIEPSRTRTFHSRG
jgi:single-stranded DNA-binding protein